ncbi:MAG: hypothetical protein V2A56_11325 [bacterium]
MTASEDPFWSNYDPMPTMPADDCRFYRCYVFNILELTAAFSGDIQGHVEILQAPRSQQEAASPWARSRNLEETESIEPIRDEILAVIYLEANSWLDAK